MEGRMRNAEGDDWQLRICEKARKGKWVTVTAKLMPWGKEPESSLGTTPWMVLKSLKETKRDSVISASELWGGTRHAGPGDLLQPWDPRTKD